MGSPVLLRYLGNPDAGLAPSNQVSLEKLGQWGRLPVLLAAQALL